MEREEHALDARRKRQAQAEADAASLDRRKWQFATMQMMYRVNPLLLKDNRVIRSNYAGSVPTLHGRTLASQLVEKDMLEALCKADFKHN